MVTKSSTLARDVDPEVIVQAIKDNKAALVGICSLMTTTMPQIDNTIAAIRAAGLKTKVMVGGAVVSQDYADQAAQTSTLKTVSLPLTTQMITLKH